MTFDDGDVDVLGATDVQSGVQVYEVYGDDRWKRDDRASGAYHAGDDGGGREEHKEPWASPLPARLSIGSMNGARGAGRGSLRGKEKARGRGAATAGANGDDGEEEGARPRKKPREARGRHN